MSNYYNTGEKETIEIIEDAGLGKGFCLGNAIKYLSRAGKKDGESEAKDLKKARDYICRYSHKVWFKDEYQDMGHIAEDKDECMEILFRWSNDGYRHFDCDKLFNFIKKRLSELDE